MITLYPYDIIDFGKNKGHQLAEIYKYQPSYLEWAILNVEKFKISIEDFEKLPNPTVLEYKSENFSGKVTELKNKQFSLMEILTISDTLNPFVSIDEINAIIQNGSMELKEVEYKFPDNIVRINNQK